MKLLQISNKNIVDYKRFMAVFTQVLNPITGQNEWASQDASYDYHQEVANAGFGDMLHDTERNQKYYQALRKTIKALHRQGKEAHVLDIGTGTGILSMMAVKSGADSVTACEAFIPMANCAENILAANGMLDKVKLIKKRSTDIEVGKDMAKRANLLVTEVLDTELIGEGAIGIYNHAHDHLLTDDVVCIPNFATCYAQVAQSSLGGQLNSLKSVANLDGDLLLQAPKEIGECRGAANLHDVQLSQMPMELWHPVTQPVEIFKFDFISKARRLEERANNITVTSCAAGRTDVVYYWWEIVMDREKEIKLSCAPFWAHPDFKKLAAENNTSKPIANIVPWRDHWMQAIYYISNPLNVFQAGTEFILSSNHDEYSLWFDVLPKTEENLKKSPSRHQCSCMLHLTYPRSRIGQMNQSVRNKKYLRFLEENVCKDSQVLVIGDGCHIGLSSAALGAKKVWCYEPQRLSRLFAQSVSNANNLKNVEFIERLEDLEINALNELTHIFSEPYFLTSILPWDNFYFGTALMKIQDKLPSCTKITPFGARIYAVPVEFLDLHKIRKPIENCEGFDLTHFDDMVKQSMSLAQSKIEAQPLWEYPCKALSKPATLLQVEFLDFNKEQIVQGEIPIEISLSCNGIALWVEWQIDDSGSAKSCVSSGPAAEPIEVGKFIKWDMFGRQGVHLLDKTLKVNNGTSNVQWKIEYKPVQGILDFNFDVKIIKRLSADVKIFRTANQKSNIGF